jgi:hypothetical protein
MPRIVATTYQNARCLFIGIVSSSGYITSNVMIINEMVTWKEADVAYYIVTCIPIAKQRFGKQASIIEILFSIGSAPQPLLCNGSVNTLQK